MKPKRQAERETIERHFIKCRVRTCTDCGHTENPYTRTSCVHESCSCKGFCRYEEEPDRAAYARLNEVLRRYGPSRVEIIVNGLQITPLTPMKPKRPKSDGVPLNKLDGPVRRKAPKRKSVNYLDGLFDYLEGKK